MRDSETLRIDDSCVQCRLQRSNAIRRPRRNRKAFEELNVKKRNVYINFVNQEKERLVLVEAEKQHPIFENKTSPDVINEKT